MITRFADRSRVSTLLACLSLVGISACASEGDDPLGDRGGAATNDPTFDLRATSPAVPETIVEGGSFAWAVVVSNNGTSTFQNRQDPAVVRLEVSGNGSGTLSTITGCDSTEPNIWLCQIETLPVGSTRQYGVTVVAGSAGTITVTATVSPRQDADPSNNTTTQVVQVVGLEPCPEPPPCMEFSDNPRKRCEMQPKAAGTACEEAGCLAGVCDGQGACGQLASKCEVGACTTATCDPTSNECIIANKTDGTVCTSSSNCDGPGRCEAGVCNGADSIVCDDGNACTTDACVMGENRRYTCQHTPKVCAGYGNCGDGVCNPETGACEVVVDHTRCDDGLACTDDLCTSSGCTNVPKHERCEDTNLCDALLPVCDENQGCIQTTCRPRIHGDCDGVAPKNCDDGNACTTDSCNPATGTCNNAAVVCNDGNACTTDSCDATTGQCRYDVRTCDDNNACTIDSCDLATGLCKNTPKTCNDGLSCTTDACVNGACVFTPNNNECQDGNACNGAEVCDPTRGGCVPGTPVTCDDSDKCTVDSCNPQTGTCSSTAVTCNDGNPCTNDACNPQTGTCTATPRSCDDNNPCTVDSCDTATGQCKNVLKSCNDGNLCTTDSCDATTGQCTHGTVSCDDGNACNGIEACEPTKGCLLGPPVVCDDGDACNGAETCDPASGCRPGTAPNCDDGNGCTIDSCDSSTGQCRHTPKSCNDGDSCTTDSCNAATGQCVFTAKTCNDNIACTTDACVEGACVFTPNNGQCSDNNACDGVEICDPTRGCVEGAPKNCDDGNACTTDACNPQTGACSNTAVSCNDQNPCTNDSCDPTTGTCKFEAKVCNDGNACTMDSCNAQTGQCVYTPKSCDDGIACTADSCQAGECVHAPRNDQCGDNNLCNGVEVCDPARNGCVPGTPKNCDDSNACTVDSCNPATGTCTNAAVSCNDQNPCTVDSCDQATGQCKFEAKSCDDGNACTNDSCNPVSGLCVNAPKSCDDGIACTADSCVAGACVNEPRNDQCADNNLCNGAEVCDPARMGCVPGTPKSCDDGNLCTSDSCNPATGACTNAAVSCNDQNPCTNDSCNPATGTCTFEAKSCDDNNPCTIDSCNAATGTCRNVAKSCDDGVACTADACVAGECVHTPDNNQCSDNNACDGVEICDPARGGCVEGTPKNCNDQSACTTDSCNPATGQCVNAAIACNDGDPCTNDSCDPVLGCRSTPKVCDDGIACTTDACVAGECVFTAQPSLCNDGNVCNGGETCDPTRGCVPGQPLVCNDGNVCTNDSCDPVRGCVTTNNTNPCDDGNACNNACLDWEVEPVAAWTLTNFDGGDGEHGFWLPGFNGGNGVTYMTLQSDTKLAWWDDGSAMITGTAVVTASAGNVGLGDSYGVEMYFTYRGQGPAGEGSGGPKMSPLVEYEDTLGWHYFDLTSGFLFGIDDTSDFVTFEQYPADSMMPFQLGLGANDKTLDLGAATWLSFDRSFAGGASAGVGDLNADLQVYECSTQDMCVDGQCVGRGPIDCDDGDQCTTDSCDPATGCTSVPFTGSCNDGNACTTEDTCSGTCSGTPIVCDDQNACTTDSCDPVVGCVFEPVLNCGGACAYCTGVTGVTLKVDTWSQSREAGEIIRVRANNTAGAVLFEGPVNNAGTFEFNLPAGVTQVVVTVQGPSHPSETQKAAFTFNCDTQIGTTNGNAYVIFKVVDLRKRIDAESCDDGDECTTDLCTEAGCTNTPIPGCGLCPTCVGVQTATVKVTSWDGSRDQNETVRIRANSTSGTVLYSGKIANNASVTVTLPVGTTSIVLTVQGQYHQTETQKASFAMNCSTTTGTVNGNSYIKFTLTGLVKRTEGVNCDDGDECTTDSCTANGCTNTPIPNCGLCPTCVGVQTATVKVTSWDGSRDQNETVRIRANSISGTVLYSGKIANNASVTVTLPAGATSIVLTVQGTYHQNETQKASFAMNCATTTGTVNGNSYIKFTLTGLTQRTEGESCDDGDECTTDQCTAVGCTNTEIPGCRGCEYCTGVTSITFKVTSWSSTRDQNETVRIRKNSSSGTKLYEGKIANNGSVTVNVPSDTTKLYLTVKGTYHQTETTKAVFDVNCALQNGTVNGNSYIKFTATSVVKATTTQSCEDNNACTTDTCTATGCAHTPIAGCGGACVEPTGEQLDEPITFNVTEAIVTMTSFFYTNEGHTKVCYSVQNDPNPPDISNFVFGISCKSLYYKTTINGAERNLGKPGPVRSGTCGTFNGLKVDDGLNGNAVSNVCFFYTERLEFGYEEFFWVKAGQVCGTGHVPGIESCEPVRICD